MGWWTTHEISKVLTVVIYDVGLTNRLKSAINIGKTCLIIDSIHDGMARKRGWHYRFYVRVIPNNLTKDQ